MCYYGMVLLMIFALSHGKTVYQNFNQACDTEHVILSSAFGKNMTDTEPLMCLAHCAKDAYCLAVNIKQEEHYVRCEIIKEPVGNCSAHPIKGGKAFIKEVCCLSC